MKISPQIQKFDFKVLITCWKLKTTDIQEPWPKLKESVFKKCRPKAGAIFLADCAIILEITFICNHINKNLHLQRTQKFYILQLFLHCFLHSTTWFWPKSTSTSNPKFYILQDFFYTFSTFYKSIFGQFYILQNNRAPP